MEPVEKRYGIWSGVSKRFVFGIIEPTKNKAWKALWHHIGDDARKWRWEVRKVPVGYDFKNPHASKRNAEPSEASLKRKAKRDSEKAKYNLEMQNYNGIPLRLIFRRDYPDKKAKRFAINATNQNVWIPNKHLEEDGTIKAGENLEYIFDRAPRQLELAGIRKI